MKIVVDTNVLFSFFWHSSLTRKLLVNSSFELISPQIALHEIEKYSDEICKRLKITGSEFWEQLKNLKKIMRFIDKEEYSLFIKEAESISPDKDDAEFFALCIKHSCLMWSNDSKLKEQNKIKVLSTEDIIEILY